MTTAAVVQAVQAARDARTPLRIRGAGTWLDAGCPVSAPHTLSVADDRGIVEYVPGDLTMTARAGSSLAELDQAARAHGQWLPLAPWGSSQATLGATIATATAGPYAAAFGVPRDAVLGLEFVTGAGSVVRAGGRVVKNVAGFDLTRLLTGSWGTLGVITEATVRLRALPQHSRCLAIRVDDEPAAIGDMATRVRRLPFAPFVAELVNANMARRLGLPSRTTMIVQIGGNASALAAQGDLLREIGVAEEVSAGVIDMLRSADHDAAVTWRLSAKPTRFSGLWAVASAIPDAAVHGSPVRGVVRVASPNPTPAAATSGATLIIEKMPRELWRSASAPDADPLREAVRAKFDPDRILNPGILGAQA